jgi:hypothetical protein
MEHELYIKQDSLDSNSYIVILLYLSMSKDLLHNFAKSYFPGDNYQLIYLEALVA